MCRKMNLGVHRHQFCRSSTSRSRWTSSALSPVVGRFNFFNSFRRIGTVIISIGLDGVYTISEGLASIISTLLSFLDLALRVFLVGVRWTASVSCDVCVTETDVSIYTIDR
ncbi:unnamed protein product [Albugo candida]|uniref:Uncharacterized protein n=1 Tax=Albugo candida TaxID=65357 RepID=A0A024FTR7_9STRA|nr:unnamed protein product [Albugo candida]|eukprot:CCI10490.1 unnamed protein product [Albugo candida]